MAMTTQAVADGIGTNLERDGYSISSETLDGCEVAVARRRKHLSRATIVIAQVTPLEAEAAKTFFNRALGLEARDDRPLLGVASMGVTVVVSDTVDPEAVRWVRSRRLDASLFPVIVDVATRKVIYPGVTVLGAIDWINKRRLVRRCVMPVVARDS